MKSMKFRVNSHEHSEAIQKRLFEMGFEWWGNNLQTIEKTDSKFLFADYSDMVITSLVDDEQYFIDKPFTETTLEDITEWIPKQGEMIEVSYHENFNFVTREFLCMDNGRYVCKTPTCNYVSWTLARPINTIRKEINELKARINELESKL